MLARIEVMALGVIGSDLLLGIVPATVILDSLCRAD